MRSVASLCLRRPAAFHRGGPSLYVVLSRLAWCRVYTQHRSFFAQDFPDSGRVQIGLLRYIPQGEACLLGACESLAPPRAGLRTLLLQLLLFALEVALRFPHISTRFLL